MIKVKLRNPIYFNENSPKSTLHFTKNGIPKESQKVQQKILNTIITHFNISNDER